VRAELHQAEGDPDTWTLSPGRRRSIAGFVDLCEEDNRDGETSKCHGRIARNSSCSRWKGEGVVAHSLRSSEERGWRWNGVASELARRQQWQRSCARFGARYRKKNGALGVGPTLDKLGARGKGSRPPGASGAAPRMAELAGRLDCSNLK
jgi:hypothetical protein